MREPLEGTDVSGRGQTDAADSIESLLESEDTETVVERLSESGTRYHVSESNVDDIVGSTASADGDTDSESVAFGGEPSRTVSSEGIDEVFEKLEAEAAAREEDPIAASPTVERRPDDWESSPFDAADRDPDFDELKREYGSLSGSAPERTISDESVDDILALVSDDADPDADDRSSGRTDGESIRPADPDAAMSSLFDDATVSGGPESMDESIRE
ncbi:hypothetical protein [Halosolutus gelatinilyticus]|uniref:hypothetical protein n=1 Tax=Halosolutus gelatinilyticus TaxID=2931975 RepID=UPI001FF5206D|nr:hypothetical protein [Halosolutus gelatinilyticus]